MDKLVKINNMKVVVMVVAIFVVIGFPINFNASTLDLDDKGRAFNGCLDWGIDTNYYDTLQEGNLAYTTMYYNAPNGCENIAGEEIEIDMPDQLTNTVIKIDEEHFEVETDDNITLKFKDEVNSYESFGGYFTIESFAHLNQGNAKWSITFDEIVQEQGTLSLAGDYGKNLIGKYANNGYGTWVDGEWVYILPKNTTQIDYQIDVNTVSDYAFTDSVVRDFVPLSQEIIPATIRIYDYRWNDVTDKINYEVTSNTLKVNLGTMKGPFHIKYSANILSNANEYVSNASLTSNEVTADAYAIVKSENGNGHWEYIQQYIIENIK